MGVLATDVVGAGADLAEAGPLVGLLGAFVGDHDRRNNHRHKDRAGEDKAGASEAAEPASLGERIVFRLKQWGITLSYLVVAVAIIALIRTFIIQSFTIPSGSMENTLNEGDRVTVTMYDSDKVHRGDVVVFTDPDHWLTTQEPTGLQGAAQDSSSRSVSSPRTPATTSSSGSSECPVTTSWPMGRAP